MDNSSTKKVIACHQPGYIPFPGFFAKMLRSDLFVFMDFVQLNKRSWQVRNRIKTRNGPTWLTVPVYTKGKYHQKIKECRIVDNLWRHKHWEKIRHNYHQSPYFKDYSDFFEKIYSKKWEWLVDLNLYIIEGLREFLNIFTPIIIAENVQFKKTKTDLIIEICKYYNATDYLSSDREVDYIEPEKFKKAGINQYYLNYTPIQYPQLFGDFIPNLSVIDLLFNCGPYSRYVMIGEKVEVG
ncbi:MAG: WbqC family protein [bacterium]